MTNELLKIISFRLDDTTRDQLEVEAAKTGRTLGEYSRDVVIASLGGSKESTMLLEQISSLHKSFADVRLKLSNAMEMVMVLSEKATREQAKEWVNNYMRR